MAAVCVGTLHRWETASGKQLAPVTAADEKVWSIAFFPDGHRLALAVELAPPRHGRFLRILDLRTGTGWNTPLAFDTRPPYPALAVSPNGKFVAVVSKGTKVSLWDADTKKQFPQFPDYGRAIHALAFSPDGKTLAFALGRNGVRGNPEEPILVWDILSGKYRGELPGHNDGVLSLAYTPDGSLLVSGGRDDKIRVWDVRKFKEVRAIRTLNTQVALCPHGKRIAACSHSRPMTLWDITSGKLILEFPVSTSGTAVAFSPDGKQLAVGGHAAAITLWDVATGKEARPFEGHRHGILSVAFSPAGKFLASRGGDQTVRLWDVERSRLLYTFPMRMEIGYTYLFGNFLPLPEGLAFSPDGNFLAAAGTTMVLEKAYLWDVGRRKLKSQWLEPRFTPQALAFTPDGKAVVTVSRHGAKLRSVPEGDVSSTLEGAPRVFKGSAGFQGLAVSPTGHFAALCGSGYDEIRLWDYETGRELRVLETPHLEANHVAFSPDGQFLASGGFRGGYRDVKRIILWEVATGTRLSTLGEKKDYFHDTFAFSPDGRLLATVDYGPKWHPCVRVWNVFTGAEVAQLDGHKAPVMCVAFSPDGNLLATGSADTTVLLWDTSKFDRRIPATKPDAKELERLWIELQSRDGAQVWTTLRTLIGAGDAAVALLAGHLDPVAAPDAKAVRSLLTKLEADEFPVRDAAAKKLLAMGETIEPLLQEALKKGGSLEFTKQVRQLVQAARSPVLGTEQVRQRRALLVLGQVGSKAARACLQRLAAGAPAAGLTREARATLDFLKRTPPP